MTDIVRIEDGPGIDLEVGNTVVPKAANVLSVQQGSLEYAPDFGVDLAYFLDNPIEFQTASFQSYLIQRLAQHMINVTEAIPILQKFINQLNLKVRSSESQNEGMIL